MTRRRFVGGRQAGAVAALAALLLAGAGLSGTATAAEDPSEPEPALEAWDFEDTAADLPVAVGEAQVSRSTTSHSGQAGVLVGRTGPGAGGAELEIATDGLVVGTWYDLTLQYRFTGGTPVVTLEGTPLVWWDFGPMTPTASHAHGYGPNDTWLDGGIHFQYAGEASLRLQIVTFDPSAQWCGQSNPPPSSAWVDDIALHVSGGQAPMPVFTPQDCPAPTTTTTTGSTTTTTVPGGGTGGTTTTTTRSPGPGITSNPVTTTTWTTSAAPTTTTAPVTPTTTRTTTPTRPTPTRPTRTRPTPPKPPAPHCEGAWTVAAAWPGHYLATVVVTATTPIRGWSTTWALGDGESVESAWWARVGGSGSAVTASNTRWNGTLPAGGRAFFSLIVQTPGPALAPLGTCTAR